MAARRVEQIINRKLGRYATALIYAVLEWVLIVLLFLDGVIAYAISEIARFFELETPCLLCSRIDRVFKERDPDFYYRDLICDSHAKEVSSLAYCHIHQKLSNINKMCENCLISHPVENKSNSETSKLPIISENDSVQVNFDPGLEKCIKTHMKESSEKSTTRCCSCCNDPLRIGSYSQRQAQMVSIGNELAKEYSMPSTVSIHRESFMKKRESNAKRTKGSCSSGQLSHIGCVELSLTPDMGSEIRDGSYLSSVVSENAVCKEDSLGQFLPQNKENPISSPCVSSQGVSIIMDSLPTIRVSEASVGVPDEQIPDLSALDCLPQGLQRPQNEGLSVTRINFDSKESKDIGLEPGSEKQDWFKGSLQPSEFRTAPTSVVEDNIMVGPKVKSCDDIKETGIQFHPCTFEGSLDSKRTIGEATLLANKILDNTYKIAEANSRTPTFRNLLCDFPFAKKETPRAQEDIKSVVSQGFEHPWSDVGPAIHGYSDDFRVSGATSPTGLQVPQQKRLSVERDESGVESLDDSIVSEIEGESMADRLMRQIQLDHRSLIALYQELDEERSSSAVAANQAMAMITRLQEEKATVQMEALQYQRMMEEQAEYDQDALQVMNELLIKREKELRVLEAEAETYRTRFQYEVAEELKREGRRTLIKKYREVGSDYYSELEWKDDEKSGLLSVDYQELKSRSPSSIGEKSEDGSSGNHDENGPETGEWKEKEPTILDKLLSDFEDDRLYLLERLKILKQKSCSCSNGNYGIPNAIDDEIHWDKEDGDSTQSTGYVTETSPGDRTNSPIIATGSKIEPGFHENLFPDVPVQESASYSLLFRDNGNSGSREISQLSERLEALEADKEFLKHAVTSLQKGGEGAQLLQEIAQHLRELRRIETRPLDNGFAS